MTARWKSLQVPTIPEGVVGDWAVERFTVTKEQAEMDRLRSMFAYGSRGRCVPEGTYTRLRRGGAVWMSDTPDEIADHYEPIRRAKGEVLIHGLGLGVVANACLMKPEVDRVTVVELAAEVIELVGPWLQAQATAHGTPLCIVHDDALTWTPTRGARWDMVWHDIWPTICYDHLEDMKRLHRRFGRRASWQGSWARDLCEARR